MKTPVTLNGEAVYSAQDFAEMTKRDVQTIYSYISIGNQIRSLRTRMFGGKPFILATEFTKFPFTGRGPNSKHRVSHFNAETGEEVLCEACSKAGRDTHSEL